MISTRNVVLSAASLVAVAQALTVNTPASAVQCQPVALSWGEGTAPFYVSIIPGGQPSAAALENLPTQQGMTYTWMVDIDAGTAITVKVVDSTGDVNYSDQITIQQGTTTTCSSSDSAGGAAAGGASSASSAVSAASSAASSAVGGASSSASSALASVRTPLSSGATSARSTGASSATTGNTSGIGANAAATTSSTGAASMGATAGFGLLGAGLLFALAA